MKELEKQVKTSIVSDVDNSSKKKIETPLALY